MVPFVQGHESQHGGFVAFVALNDAVSLGYVVDSKPSADSSAEVALCGGTRRGREVS